MFLSSMAAVQMEAAVSAERIPGSDGDFLPVDRQGCNIGSHFAEPTDYLPDPGDGNSVCQDRRDGCPLGRTCGGRPRIYSGVCSGIGGDEGVEAPGGRKTRNGCGIKAIAA